MVAESANERVDDEDGRMLSVIEVGGKPKNSGKRTWEL
jgi:hypothetical protein